MNKNRRRRERELSAELQRHLEMHIADNVRAGMTPEEARREALLALGRVEQTKQRYRAALNFRWIDALVKDIQFGVRTMRRSSGFAMLAIVTLAIGIAATHTAFMIMNTVMSASMQGIKHLRCQILASGLSSGRHLFRFCFFGFALLCAFNPK